VETLLLRLARNLTWGALPDEAKRQITVHAAELFDGNYKICSDLAARGEWEHLPLPKRLKTAIKEAVDLALRSDSPEV
jgi:hypothetical protein